MRVAILYICLGKYTVFWDEFYESFEKNFLPNLEKTYFVFTDNKKLPFSQNKNVCIIPQKNLGWPDNTLQRFSLFVREEYRWKDFDYTFFVNANFLCVEEIAAEEFLPITEELVVAEHANVHGKSPSEFTYDRNPKSLACVKEGEGKYYVMGGLNGGKTRSYMEMIHKLKENVDEDARNGVMALWHDESHLNRFIIGRTDVKVLPPCYGYPEGKDYPYKAKFLIREKSRYFDVEAIKADGCIGRIKLYVDRFKTKLALRVRLRRILEHIKK